MLKLSCSHLLVCLLSFWLAFLNPVAGWALSTEHYICDGEPLEATYDSGPVDAISLPNTIDGTVPGSVVVLRWRDLTLQLPRTNVAISPIYSDGKWTWSLESGVEQPRFLLNQGATVRFACLMEDEVD